MYLFNTFKLSCYVRFLSQEILITQGRAYPCLGVSHALHGSQMDP